ncbi:type II RES/Xre toxin-antitoxin system antitoxin [Geoalkalibacter halelectricus]|nr:antitoxin Xre/MbcA/ParS toxin-binding domain-containing protein [Geoalkalibacter halelectricus]MDO3376855.1 DUF2384 domain-containing protein [Geoalkalibacter halelectricus]
MTGQAIAKTLGLDEQGESPMALVEIVRRGLPREALEALASSLRVSLSDLAEILPVSPRTLQRYSASKVRLLPKELSDHMLQIAKVYVRALEVFEDEERALAWLHAPIMSLGGKVPLSLLDTSAGVDLVMTTLGRIEYGVFA